ncbi:MAG: NAD(P)-dependent oxidoreductase [Actinobacteria bacterium]|nr:NAD(P)-dependent oxidoreductase [Actinomycetota bacterium]
MGEAVAVLGTGAMGAPIARNLGRAGFDVRVWNRTREKAEGLGATVCDEPAEAVAGAAFVLTMLADGPAVEQTMARAIDAFVDGAVWLQVSTVGVDAEARLRRLAEDRGVAYVDSPVLGTRAPAENGELVILASGPEELRERVAPVFDAIGKQTRWVGEAGHGTRLKLVANLWVLSLTVAAGECIALAEGFGLDPHEFLDTIAGAQSDSPYLHLKGEAILERRLDPSFRLELAHKDARLITEAAREAGVDDRMARAVRDAMHHAVELGHGDEDMAAAYFAAVS